jgi:hypothetical protein
MCKGLLGYGTGVDLAAGFAAVPLLGSLMGGDEAPEVRKEKLNVNYPKVKDLVTKFKIRDYSTGKDNQLDVGESVEERLGDNYVSRYKHGGIARFNSGDLVNKLPSKHNMMKKIILYIQEQLILLRMSLETAMKTKILC